MNRIQDDELAHTDVVQDRLSSVRAVIAVFGGVRALPSLESGFDDGAFGAHAVNFTCSGYCVFVLHGAL